MFFCFAVSSVRRHLGVNGTVWCILATDGNKESFETWDWFVTFRLCVMNSRRLISFYMLKLAEAVPVIVPFSA